MIVDNNFQQITYPFDKLNVCPFPFVKIEHGFDNILSWDEIVDLNNKQIINNQFLKHIERNIIHYHVKKIQNKKTKIIEERLNILFPGVYVDVDLHGSFENNVGGLKIHEDMESTILHVQQGEIILNILTGNISYIFNMKQNDMIYIKKGIKHAVIGITPRFLVSYGIFD
jgi:mannose-6-phosphate isomerase-like protein (cupin superfamily)